MEDMHTHIHTGAGIVVFVCCGENDFGVSGTGTAHGFWKRGVSFDRVRRFA